MKLVTHPVTVPLLGHGLQSPAGMIAPEPTVTGTLAEDLIQGTDGALYALLTVPDDGQNPALWAGVYRVNFDRLRAFTTDVNTNQCYIIESEV